MKITVFSTAEFERPYLKKFLPDNCNFVKDNLDKNSFHLAKDSEAIAIFTSDIVDRDILTDLKNIGVRFILLRMAGFDNVDLDFCKEIGIKVANVPKYSPYSVAQQAATLMLSLIRKVKLAQNLIAKNDFTLDKLVGFDLNKKTVGIVGTGNIGAVFAQICRGFGAKILAFDPKPSPDIGVKYTEFDYLCKNSDIISIHCPLNKETQHLFDENRLMSLKKGALLINTARGAIIDSKALIKALDQQIVSGAGLDVYEFEKNLFFKKHDKVDDDIFKNLQSRDNVIISAHQGFLTQEALTSIAQTTADNLRDFSNKNTSSNEIT